MDIDSYIEDTLSELGSLYSEMAVLLEAPVFVDLGGYKGWRYKTKSASLACFLKGVRVVSSLNASMVLLRAGYTQEIGALCRMIADYCSEIIFILTTPDENNFSKYQVQFLDDFYKEEFDKPMNPLGSTQKRVNVPVKKIHASFGKALQSDMNPSDAQELLRTTHKAFSGYVHGAYPHIMEMFGGAQPRINGMLGTARIEEWRRQIITYVYRALMISIVVARKFGYSDIEAKARKLRDNFETETGCKSDKTLTEMLSEMKKSAT
jgi:hypothetical protein